MNKNIVENKIELSIIIPAYKAETYIAKSLLKKLDVLDALNINYELIVVLDGDGENAIRELSKINNKNLRIISYKKNKGKGFAVRYACMQAKGRFIGYTDADNDIDPEIIATMYQTMNSTDADMIVPSKYHSSSIVEQSPRRRIISKLFSIFNKLIFHLPVSDTQLGAKLYKRELVNKVFPRLIVKRFAFETEIIKVSYALGFKKIIEVPVKLKLATKSTIKIYDGIKAIIDTLTIIYRLKILHYYSDNQGIKINLPRHNLTKIRML